jgi:hypothetical protein
LILIEQDMAKRRAATPAGVKASATPAKLPAKATKVRIREPESKVDAKTESKVDAKKTTPAAARPESKVDAKKTTPAAARPESKVNAQKTTPAAARPKMPAKAVADPSMRQLLFTSALISASSWDYFASPPSNSLKVCSVLNQAWKTRQVLCWETWRFNKLVRLVDILLTVSIFWHTGKDRSTFCQSIQ